MSNGKGHFGLTDRNNQTGQSGPPSKLVLNILVGPNQNGPLHLMYQLKFPDFWVEWKAALVAKGAQVRHLQGPPCADRTQPLISGSYWPCFWLKMKALLTLHYCKEQGHDSVVQLLKVN